ncbi:MAG: hypothetical protein JXA09_03960 [Anaerolineae bacterium]|nr:hypothetical protein [Anaerolineae bacterium]
MASSATLNTIRDRIRDQVESASGQTEPLVVTASSLQLSSGTPNYRDRVELHLQDSGNSIWATDDIDEALRTALQFYSRANPQHAIGAITVSTAGREQSLASLTGLLRVEKVWWDYDSSDPAHPPNWRQFEVWPGAVLYIDDRAEPAATDVIRVWYTKAHTINGLDGATSTTVPKEDEDVLVAGAAHFAARFRAIELAEQATVDRDVVERLERWAEEQGKAFRYGVRQQPPAWQRRAYGYDQGDIDEAVRWALYRYNEVNPNREIASITLSADGREVDISGVTGYLDIYRVWWDYDSADPAYPPEWREFEVWPGDILYVKDGDEPRSGDVVRVWYTLPHTISGLDAATATTVSDRDINLIVTGASGFVTQERVQDEATRSVPTKLREWAQARIAEFDAGLLRVARRIAADASGLASLPSLDRWDDGDGWS